MDEWLALVGGSWQPVLLYPGLLTSLVVTALMRAVWLDRTQPAAGRPWRPRWDSTAVFAAASTLLLLALLPFPHSYWAYPIDLPSAIFLLEAPYWLRLAQRLRTPALQIRRSAADEISALLNVYLLMALAIAAMGQAAGSLLVTEVKGGTPLLHWLGIVGWAIALPPLLAFGPWRQRNTSEWPTDLRRVGHIALLLAIALPSDVRWSYGATAIGAIACFGSLTLLHHFWRGDPQQWERFQPFVALIILAGLLYVSGQDWLARLQ